MIYLILVLAVIALVLFVYVVRMLAITRHSPITYQYTYTQMAMMPEPLARHIALMCDVCND
jgi:hypothetical protein